MKQVTLKKWVKKDATVSKSVIKNPPKVSPRITLDMDSVLKDYQDLIAELEGNKIVLYIKNKQIPIYVAKIDKNQFLTLCQLDDDLSPAKIKEIIPDLDDSMVLSVCQFLLSQRVKTIQSKKSVNQPLF